MTYSVDAQGRQDLEDKIRQENLKKQRGGGEVESTPDGRMERRWSEIVQDRSKEECMCMSLVVTS